jgi:MFS family permease
VPPSLFRSRNFSVTNISTLLIYGALYVFSYYLALFLQGTLGYTALGSGLAGLPSGLALATLSTSFGQLAGRLGPRRFMAIGPALMGLGLLWFLRIPADSHAWPATVTDLSTLVPPAAYLTDVLPANLLFAFGIAMLVAPLTTALMTSVPVGNSGLASAINNALSRIGPILAGAVIFIGVTASFYGGLAQQVPSLDTDSAEVRAAIPPLKEPAPDLPDDVKQAARASSTEAFHLAMLIAAVLCASGAAVNWVGIVDPKQPATSTATQPAASGG